MGRTRLKRHSRSRGCDVRVDNTGHSQNSESILVIAYMTAPNF